MLYWFNMHSIKGMVNAFKRESVVGCKFVDVSEMAKGEQMISNRNA